MAMETMTRVNEQMEVSAKKPMAVQPGVARMRELTPAQRRAVMFAQQQVLKAQAAKKAKDERQAARDRMRQEQESASYQPNAVAETAVAEEEPREVSLRGAIGHVLRDLRTRDRRTLREVSEKAGVSLGYLSEVERGQKEASSELLEAITSALRVPLWFVLREVSERMAIIDGAVVPDAVPDDIVPVTLIS